jgi:DNA (cytosine-5)-methyltransferase 1
MFLASPWNLQIREMAEVEIGLLETQVGTEPKTRPASRTATAHGGLARARALGMPVEHAGGPRESNPCVPGSRMRSIELFTGAGGLALGIENAGFHHDLVVERDKDCCKTISENQSRGFVPLQGWRLFSDDVRKMDFSDIKGEVHLLAGGPPCQPFSIGGKHKGPLDKRDMFPEVVRAVRQLKPHAVMVENVRGLLRESFAKYFEYIILQLRYPELLSKRDEDWSDHLSRLERHHTKGREKGLCYNVVFRPLNAANYGVPQKRERVIIVAFRSDLGVEWSFPEATHTLESLLVDQWVTGDYWERHQIAKRKRPTMSARLAGRVQRLKYEASLFGSEPWRTVRDAIGGLPDPEKGSSGLHNHQHNPGARSYLGHSGSPLDEPAKTLKAGDHGVPGGENMLVMPDGRIRYFTVRESARLQTFPDDYVLHGAWTEAMRQLGNAVPVLLSETVALAIRKKLTHEKHMPSCDSIRTNSAQFRPI